MRVCYKSKYENLSKICEHELNSYCTCNQTQNYLGNNVFPIQILFWRRSMEKLAKFAVQYQHVFNSNTSTFHTKLNISIFVKLLEKLKCKK